MNISINGQKDSVNQESITVQELLKTKDVPDPDMVSVQLNGSILDRASFSTQQVKEGDEFEFLYFMGGGQ
ncbi:MAG: sulfur carrier protein ThiS [Spirochaetales bacterium]|nr:sulfur carrier protein ThiS [Spirochaetales bacterium]